jgi:hypothetical protein
VEGSRTSPPQPGRETHQEPILLLPWLCSTTSTLPSRTARTVAFLQLAPDLNAEEFEEQFLNARAQIFAYTEDLLTAAVRDFNSGFVALESQTA